MRPEMRLLTRGGEEWLSRERLLLRALACGLLVVTVLRPPETYPWALAAGRLLLAASIGLIWFGAKGAGARLPRWTAGLLPFVLAVLFVAPCRGHALDEAGAVSELILAALLGTALASDRQGRDGVLGVLVALGVVAALLAVLQHHVTYREELRGLLGGAEAPSAYVIARLQAGRPSGPFSLPAALGGFFALTLPLTISWARHCADPWQKTGALAAALLQSYALILTGSIGGIAATACSVFLSLPASAARGRVVRLAAVSLAALAIVFLVMHQRRVELGSPGGHPLLLRAGNWRAATEMIRDHPLFGTGPGSFGTFYPRYMRPGMNETRYAHDSYLQTIAEWGGWALLPIGCFLVAFAARLRRAWARCSVDLSFAAAGAGFLIHNLVDFTAYLPGVAIPAAILIGLGLGAEPRRDLPSDPADLARVRAIPWKTALVALGLIVFVGHALLAARAEALVERARSAVTKGSIGEALDLARGAVRVRPDDPVPRGFIAEWVLRHGMDDPSLRREGEREVVRAVRLDPESAILHYDLSRFLLAARQAGPAYRELFLAHRLYPLKDAYRPPQEPGSTRSDP